MRLKEPLQGIKMCQGHNIVHWTFFFAMVFFLKDDPAPLKFLGQSDDDFEDQAHKYRQVHTSIQYLKWGHLMNAII